MSYRLEVGEQLFTDELKATELLSPVLELGILLLSKSLAAVEHSLGLVDVHLLEVVYNNSEQGLVSVTQHTNNMTKDQLTKHCEHDDSQQRVQAEGIPGEE